MAGSGNTARKLIGIDPGTNAMGYAVLEIQGNHLSLLDVGVLRLQKFKDHQTKLKEIFLQLQEIIETYLPQTLAIEAPFYGNNVQSMLKLGRAQGVAMAAGMTMGLEIAEYSPKKVKLSVTGNGNASKEQVAAMVVRLLGMKSRPQSLDATDALAVALCHYLQSGKPGIDDGGFKNWKSFLAANPGRLAK